jgi:outer membrane protein assembly factor BamB
MISRIAHVLLILLFLLPAALLLGGCSSSKTTLQKDWTARIGTEARTVNVGARSGHLLVGKEKETKIIDDSGQIIYGEEEKGALARFASAVKEEATDLSNVTVAGLSLSEMEANKLDYVMLPEKGMALAFDYTAEEDIIRALDVNRGEVMWERTDYRWSLEKYQAVGARIVEGMIENIGLTAGVGAAGGSAAANSTLLREQYVQDLVAKMPDQDAILLKTVEGLRRVDLSTGETRWTLSDVPGSRLMHVEWLSSGDVLAVTNHTSLLERVSGGKEILRMDPTTGTIKWRSSHSADLVQQTFQKEGFFLLQQPDGDIEAFRLDDGTKAYEIGLGLGSKIASLTGMQTERGKDALQTTITPILHRDAVYVPNIADVKMTGKTSVSYNIRKFDVSTGSEAWTSDTIEGKSSLPDFTAAGDRIVARAVKALGYGGSPSQEVVAWSPSSRTRQWSHETAFTPPDRQSSSLSYKFRRGGDNLIAHNGRICLATDTSVVAYDASDGTVEASASAQAPGGQVAFYKQNGLFVDLRQGGVHFHNPSDLSGVNTPITFEHDLLGYMRKDNYLFVMTQGSWTSDDVVYAINTQTQTLAGTVENTVGPLVVSGDLHTGMAVPDDGSAVYLLTVETEGEEVTDKLIHRYRLP